MVRLFTPPGLCPPPLLRCTTTLPLAEQGARRPGRRGAGGVKEGLDGVGGGSSVVCDRGELRVQVHCDVLVEAA